jgi:hypothetical protein
MGVHQRAGANLNKTYFEYTPLLGGLFPSDKVTQEAIKAARASVGAIQTSTFEGDRGESKSAQALKILAEQGITPVRLDGTLTGATHYAKDIGGGKPPLDKVIVELTDGDQKLVIATPLGNDAALALVRKLAHATPGEHVTVNLFATYDEGQDGRMYTNHGCSLRRVVDGRSEEIKSEAMKAAGITDREVLSKAVRNKAVEFGKEILVEVKARFKSDATAAAADDPSDASNADDALTFDASDAMPRSSAARPAMV